MYIYLGLTINVINIDITMTTNIPLANANLIPGISTLNIDDKTASIPSIMDASIITVVP